MFAGHTWNPRPSIVPALTHAAQWERDCHVSREIIAGTAWALDYALSDAGTYCIPEESDVFRKRSVGLCRILPFGTKYKDDLRSAGQRVHTCYCGIVGLEHVGLQYMLPNQGKHTRVWDKDGLIGKTLSRIAWIGEEQGENGFWNAQAVLSELIAMLAKSQRQDNGDWWLRESYLRQKDYGFVAQVRAFLEYNLEKSLSLEDIAEACEVSVSSLSHRYRQESGETPIHALTVMRIDKAKRLFLEDHSLAVVAERCGFRSESYLSRCFSKMTGLSPRTYKQLHG